MSHAIAQQDRCPHSSRAAWTGYALLGLILSILWHLSLTAGTALFLSDSVEYVGLARQIASGAASIADFPSTISPAYPFLVAKLAGPALEGAAFAPLIAVQTLLSIYSDLVVFAIAGLLTLRPSMALLGQAVSLLAIERHLMTNYVMTETLYTAVLLSLVLVFLVAARRRSLTLFFATAVLAAGLAWIKPMAAVYWPLLPAVWTLSEYRHWRGTQRDGSRLPRAGHQLALRSAYAWAGCLLIAQVVISPLNNAGDERADWHRQASALWVQTLHARDPVFIEAFRRSPFYAELQPAYARWLARRETPDDVVPNAFFLQSDAWELLERKQCGWCWFKIPVWVLTSELGYSRAEAEAWQGRAALHVVSRHPGYFLKKVLLKEPASILLKPFSKSREVVAALQQRRQAQGPDSLCAAAGLIVIDAHAAFRNVLDRTGFGSVWILLLVAGLLCSARIFGNPAAWLIAATYAFHILIPAVAGGSLARYRFPTSAFDGIVLMAAIIALLAAARRMQSKLRSRVR